MIRKRYYHYPSPIAIDRFNTRVLQALATKLTRDYSGFFNGLAKTYQKGEYKKKLDYTAMLVKKSVVLLENMISENRVSKSDVSKLVEYIEEINDSRDEFLTQAEQNKSLETKIQKVSETTGISPQDLNVTKEIITKGAVQTRKRTKEGVTPFVKRTMPGTLELGGELGHGVLSAAAGPFSPALEMAGTLAKGAWGVGKGLFQARQLRQEERLTGRLTPMAAGLPAPAYRKLAKARASHPFGANFAGISQKTPLPRRRSKEEMVFPLTYFFDKKAHKAKWTKEMSDRFKSIEKKLGQGLGGGGALGKLAKFMGGLKTLGVVAAVGAAGVAVSKIAKLPKKVVEFRAAQKEMQESKKTMQGVSGFGRGTWGEEALKKKDPKAFIEQMKKEGKIAPQIAKTLFDKLPMQLMTKKTKELKEDASDVAALTERFRRGTSKKEELLEAMPTTLKDPFARPPKENDKGLLAIQKAVEKVNDTLSRQQGSGVRGAALGDPFGVGDPILTNWSSGQITVENE